MSPKNSIKYEAYMPRFALARARPSVQNYKGAHAHTYIPTRRGAYTSGQPLYPKKEQEGEKEERARERELSAGTCKVSEWTLERRHIRP